MITVLVVDDQELMRMGLRMVLDAHDDIEVVGESNNGATALTAARRLRPDVVLMDVRMPVVDGVRATEQILDADLGCRVLVMTTFDLDEPCLSALRAGASGFLLKDTAPADLVSAVRSVACGDAVISPRMTKRLVARLLAGEPATRRDPRVLDALTQRERDVLGQLAGGRSNAEIAAALHVSEATVKTHVGRMLTKLGLRDRVQAVVLAYETGFARVTASDCLQVARNNTASDCLQVARNNTVKA